MAVRFADDQQYYNQLYGSYHHKNPHDTNNQIPSYDDQETNYVSGYPHLTNYFHSHHSGTRDIASTQGHHDQYPTHYNNPHHHHHYQAPTGAHHEMARFVEYDETRDHGKEKREYIEESIDVEADGYIKHKHKLFEIAKWNTYKE